MTHTLSHYSLTLGQYTDLRKLQLQYLKCKDQNQQLLQKLTDVEMLYQDAVKKLNDRKKNKQAQLKQKINVESQRSRQKQLIFKQITNCINIIQGVQNQQYEENQENSTVSGMLNILRVKVENITGEYIKAKSDIKQLINQAGQKQKIWAQRQQNFSNQVADLNLDFQSLQKVHLQLQQQNQKILRENQQLVAQVRSYKAIALEARKQKQKSPIKTLPNQPLDFNQQDKDFATDLLSYEKQLLVRVFELVIQSFQKDDIGLCLRKIYQAYGDVTQCFRQKLQIQYDLSDLQCQYQTRKNTSIAKDVLIQLRKQINSFRKQLFNQKQLLHKHEEILQQRIKDLSGQATHDNRLKNFTISLQTKYRREKTLGEENQILPKTNTIQFKPSYNTNEIVQQMIEKDRENLEKMLKQTRSHYRK